MIPYVLKGLDTKEVLNEDNYTTYDHGAHSGEQQSLYGGNRSMVVGDHTSLATLVISVERVFSLLEF